MNSFVGDTVPLVPPNAATMAVSASCIVAAAAAPAMPAIGTPLRARSEIRDAVWGCKPTRGGQTNESAADQDAGGTTQHL